MTSCATPAESRRLPIARNPADESISRSAGGPDHPAAQYLEGQYAVGRGLYHDAADRFTKLSQLVPDSPAPHEALGTVYRAIGLMDLAAAEFQRALELSKPQ